MSSTTNHYCPDPEKCRMYATPTPIDPADIRPGDVVERRRRYVVQKRGPDFGIDARCEDTNTYEVVNPALGTWYLVSRPDPDAEAVQAIRSASYNIHHGDTRVDPLPGLIESGTLLEKLRESGWDVTRRRP